MHWADVIRAWGLDYSGLGWEWIKRNPETGKYAFGLGYMTRKNLEPCLLLTKGEPRLRRPVPAGSLLDLPGDNAEGARSVRDFIHWHPGEELEAPLREHSRKPDLAYDNIETMFDGPYADIFAREPRANWTVWGNETSKFSEAGAA